MTGPFRTLLQSRFLTDGRTFTREVGRSLDPTLVVDTDKHVALRFDVKEYGDTRTTTELISDATALWLRVRLFSHDKPRESDIPLDLISTMVAQTKPFDSQIPILPTYWDIGNKHELQNAIADVLDPLRRLPIVLMSEPSDPRLLATARELCGVAHIMLIANRLCHGIVEALGPQWPIHGGAIRTFGTPFPGPRELHPITLASNRPPPDKFISRIRWFAVNNARNHAFPSIDALAAACNAPLPA